MTRAALLGEDGVVTRELRRMLLRARTERVTGVITIEQDRHREAQIEGHQAGDLQGAMLLLAAAIATGRRKSTAAAT